MKQKKLPPPMETTPTFAEYIDLHIQYRKFNKLYEFTEKDLVNFHFEWDKLSKQKKKQAYVAVKTSVTIFNNSRK